MVVPLSQIEEDHKEAKTEWPDARISTYAIISDFKRKSVEDIKRIKAHGLDEIMIGIETGDDDVLKFVNKGYTAQDMTDTGHKTDEAGITYRMIYLGGLAGKGKLASSAKKSAKVFNQIHPYYMILTNVTVLSGTKSTAR